MRILVLGINYWPEETGIAPFTTGRCEYLAACGHEVTVCTALPYYSEWGILPNYRRRLLVREKRNCVTILRSRIYVPKHVNSPRRIVALAHRAESSRGGLPFRGGASLRRCG